MKKTNKHLQTVLGISVAVSLIMVVLFESETILPGFRAAYGRDEFITATIMELITICAIPVLLRTFKFGFVKRSVKASGDEALGRWSMVRMSVMCALMVINTLLYYVFMNVAFGYMAIIILLCIFFIFPSVDRLKREKEECEK